MYEQNGGDIRNQRDLLYQEIDFQTIFSTCVPIASPAPYNQVETI